MTCHPSDKVGLTNEIASEIWYRAKTAVGLSDDISLAVSNRNILNDAKKLFAEIAFGHPHYATNKEIAYFTGLHQTTISTHRVAWLQQQRSERRQTQWEFKSTRRGFGEQSQS